MPRGNPKNLIPNSARTPEELKKMTRKGGKASGKVRREKKLMSQIYADVLADQSGIKKGGGIRAVIAEIMNSTDPRAKSAKVSLIKELREGTEGSKVKTETVLTINADDEKVAAILAEYGINKPESEN
jgi:hypothetical protein